MKQKQSFRKWHSTIAPIVLLPLFITVFTGVTYRISKDWFGLSRDQVHFLMSLHEGEYFGHALEPVYVLLNGLGLLWMLGTGGAMLFQKFTKFKQSIGRSSISKSNKILDSQTAVQNSQEEDSTET